MSDSYPPDSSPPSFEARLGMRVGYANWYIRMMAESQPNVEGRRGEISAFVDDGSGRILVQWDDTQGARYVQMRNLREVVR